MPSFLCVGTGTTGSSVPLRTGAFLWAMGGWIGEKGKPGAIFYSWDRCCVSPRPVIHLVFGSSVGHFPRLDLLNGACGGSFRMVEAPWTELPSLVVVPRVSGRRDR
jgi:hypothetical protein